MVRIDLHIHSDASDGTLPPADVVTRAADAGLDIIAITDHDTTAAVPPAAAAAVDAGIRLIPGIEISAAHRGRDLHFLGYGVDPDAPGLAAYVDRASTLRAERIREMIERLRGLDVHVEYDDVVAQAGPNARSLARPHLARVLWSQGHVSSVAEAFDRYIADDQPAYVPVQALDVETAIRHIHDAGGIAAWAHPPLPLMGGALAGFVDVGLDGIECYRPRVSPPDLNRLLAKARQHDLIVTGGSDWHGPWHGELGSFHLDEVRLAAFLARLRD